MTPESQRRLLVCTTGLGSGGAEMMLAQLLQRMQGVDTHVVSLAAGGKYVEQLERAGIAVTDLGMAAGRPSPAALATLKQVTLEFQPTTLLGWMYHGNLAATMARRWAGKETRLVWNIRQTLYGLRKEKLGSALVIRLLAWLSSKPDALVYNSRLSAEQHEQLGYRGDRREVVPNGVDLQRFQPDADARKALRAELGLREDTVLIGRVGRNAPMKDHATFLSAMNQLLQHWPSRGRPLHAVLVGSGMDRDDPAFADFLATQPRARCQNLHFLGERHDLPQLTAALDVAVSSSAFGEGFPNVIAEAMACGVPPVATDIGDTSTVLGDLGSLVPAGDASALAEAMEETLRQSPAQRQQIGLACRQRMTDSFSIDAVQQRYEELFFGPATPSPVNAAALST